MNSFNGSLLIFNKSLNLGRFHSYRLFFNIPYIANKTFKVTVQKNKALHLNICVN